MTRAILNFAGLAILIPLMILILDSQDSSSHFVFEKFRMWLEIDDKKTFSIVICIIIFGFIILKNILNVWLGAFQIRYVNLLFRYFSQKLYESYYNKGLLFIKNVHTSDLAHKINGVCYTLAQHVLALFFTMIGEILLLFLIWAALLLYSFKIALITLLCFLPVAWLYFYTARNRLTQYGKKENEAKRKQFQIVNETFRGYCKIISI